MPNNLKQFKGALIAHYHQQINVAELFLFNLFICCCYLWVFSNKYFMIWDFWSQDSRCTK